MRVWKKGSVCGEVRNLVASRRAVASRGRVVARPIRGRGIVWMGLVRFV